MFLLLPMDKNEQNFDDIFASFLLIEFSETVKRKIQKEPKEMLKRRNFILFFEVLD